MFAMNEFPHGTIIEACWVEKGWSTIHGWGNKRSVHWGGTVTKYGIGCQAISHTGPGAKDKAIKELTQVLLEGGFTEEDVKELRKTRYFNLRNKLREKEKNAAP